MTTVMPAPSSRTFRARSAWVWLRSAALVLFMFVLAPDTSELLEAIVCAAAGVECCEGDCCEGERDGCPQSCLHCACCPHATALLSGDELRLVPALPRRRAALGAELATDAAGYRAPPFRPPLGDRAPRTAQLARLISA